MFGAVRRYRILVLTIAILGMVAAVGYSLHEWKTYQAVANVTFQLPASSQASADPGQYLDSQVVLLQSQGVAQQAANIANRELGANLLDAQDFYGNHSSLVVDPPTTATPRRLWGHLSWRWRSGGQAQKSLRWVSTPCSRPMTRPDPTP